MEIKTEPRVYLVTRPALDWEMVAEFLSDEGLPEIPQSIRAGESESTAVVEISARLCYMSFGRGRTDIQDFISKDGSVLEHVNYGFVFTGVSRSLTHELVRHRAGFAYSQRSQRYVDESEGAFVLPPAVGESSPRAREFFTEAMKQAQDAYFKLVNALDFALPPSTFKTKTDRRKAIRSAARSVLPNATETKIFVTANVRAWRHFIEMRGSIYAEREIRYVAIEVLRQLRAEAPLLFGDFTISRADDGYEIATPEHSKV